MSLVGLKECVAETRPVQGLSEPVGTPVGQVWPTGRLVSSDMVAFDRPFTRGAGRLDYDVDKLPTTSTKLVPRKGVMPAWEHAFLEIATCTRTLQTWHDQHYPSREDVRIQVDKSGLRLSDHEFDGFYKDVFEEWWEQNTKLYYVAYGCIDLTGAYEEQDLLLIQRQFWKGELRGTAAVCFDGQLASPMSRPCASKQN